MKKFVQYCRVSTAKQGASGLGLESQEQCVKNYVGSQGEIIAAFTDIESGKNDKRPQLAKAIQLCRETSATLVIAKLDRLSRNLKFIVELQEESVSKDGKNGFKFVCCDMPEANELTINIIASMAQYERKQISERTKAGLSSKKARINAGNYINSKTDDNGNATVMKPDKNGVFRLGNPNGWTEHQRATATAKIKAKADNNDNTKMAVKRVIECLKSVPTASLAELAEKLNEYNIKTPQGKLFSRTNVQYIKKKALAQMQVV
jgi:DNA invertase Pin-like site-specific DNA recombinase